MSQFEMFSDIIFKALRIWKIASRQNSDEEQCDAQLFSSNKFFRKALRAYDNDICIENILRQIRKLECGVAALINNDKEKLDYIKILYYSNLIHFGD